jgi:hypothetical protein
LVIRRIPQPAENHLFGPVGVDRVQSVLLKQKLLEVRLKETHELGQRQGRPPRNHTRSIPSDLRRGAFVDFVLLGTSVRRFVAIRLTWRSYITLAANRQTTVGKR